MAENNKIYTGLGKRKTSVAKVFLSLGKGEISVNNIPFEIAFQSLKHEKESIKLPLLLLNLTESYDIVIHVKGGGISAQLEAIQLAISKAICTIQSSYRPQLHQEFFLRRDSRIKERRKYGLKKARKAPQYSKR
jgi:small subunit ribosomal protein S9